MRTKTNKIIEDFLSAGATSVGLVFLTFITGVAIARALGPEERGIYGSLFLMLQLSSYLGTFALFDALVYEIKKLKLNLGESVVTISIITISIALSMLFGMLFVIDRLITLEADKDVVIISIVVGPVILIIMQGGLCILRSHDKYKEINYCRLFTAAAFAATVFCCWLLESATLFFIFLSFALTRIIAIAWVLVIVKKYFKKKFNKNLFISSFRTAAKFYPSYCVGLLSNQVDRIVIVALGVWSAGLVGQYFVAFAAVGSILGVFNQALNMLLLPYLSDMDVAQRAKNGSYMFRICCWFSVCMTLLSLTIFPWAIPLVYGAEYKEAAFIAVWLGVAMSTTPAKTILMEVSRSTGNGKIPFIMHFIVLIVAALGFYVSGYEDSRDIIIMLAVSNIISVVIGIYLLWLNRVFFRKTDLVPGFSDIRLLADRIRYLWLKRYSGLSE